MSTVLRRLAPRNNDATIPTESYRALGKYALRLARPPQVSRFCAFVKPVADRFEQRARLVRPSLRSPELCKARGSPQFERPRALAPCYVDRRLKDSLGFRNV